MASKCWLMETLRSTNTGVAHNTNNGSVPFMYRSLVVDKANEDKSTTPGA